jgi:pimeloyl-ACP methyl ester carboxylesterase
MLMRKRGELLQLGAKLLCPVIAIHGDHDPHPADGVEKPLSKFLRDFQFILLKNCGHTPWLERQARAEFFNVLKEKVKSYIKNQK